MGKTLSYSAMAALLAGAAIALGGCDGGSATAARDHTASPAGVADTTVAADSGHSVLNGSADRGYASRDSGDDQNDARREPVALVNGKPMWAANRRHTAEENANYQFQRDGADFDARTLDDFVAKAHAFTASPPKDALTLYDPARNIFAVVTKDGAPRTMFKPQSGKAYWDEQVARQSDDSDNSDRSGGRSYSRRSSGRDSSDDQG
jgi:pyocin large subunit-like protein